MTNKEIAKQFALLGDIMELHQENPFKIKSYQSAYITLRKLETPLSEMSPADIAGIKGVGKAIAEKIQDLLTKGTFDALETYKASTPPGVVQMLQINGFGPKKIMAIWKDLEIETIGELHYACNENRLIELKGFGAKTQADLKQKLEYFLKSQHWHRYAELEKEANQTVELLSALFPEANVSLCGAIRRLCPTLERIEILVGFEGIDIEKNIANILSKLTEKEFSLQRKENENWLSGNTPNELPIQLIVCQTSDWGSKLFKYSTPRPVIEAFLKKNEGLDFQHIASEEAVFAKANMAYILPELREETALFEHLLTNNDRPTLIEKSDIKGVVHSHSTYSDGLHSLSDMAQHAQHLGYEYLLMSDHSKAAFYANGLKEDRLLAQWAEIDTLNAGFKNGFKILKGIESDILYDGSLDYPDTLLAGFDCIIASVHSVLKMDIEKATSRLIKAIENPYTKILGHPTGRLLLSREGYPIDHKKVIDACAANKVAIELNAHPYRLDIDWTWIPYCMEKGVFISINPDAHSIEGMNDIRYGVLAARKGGLTAEACLNTRNCNDFLKVLEK
jgi:DNA polymerase (family 10)